MHVAGIFLYQMKTSENPGFLIYTGNIESDQWHEMGRKYQLQVNLFF